MDFGELRLRFKSVALIKHRMPIMHAHCLHNSALSCNEARVGSNPVHYWRMLCANRYSVELIGFTVDFYERI